VTVSAWPPSTVLGELTAPLPAATVTRTVRVTGRVVVHQRVVGRRRSPRRDAVEPVRFTAPST